MKSRKVKREGSAARELPNTHLTIEELARRTGLTARHLRELQTRGVLDPPELEGRKGFYNERHFARVVLVRRLQHRGYSLVAIADLLARWREGAGIGAILGLEDAITHHPSGASRELLESEIMSLYPELAQQSGLLARAVEAGLLRRENGRLVAPSAQLLELGRVFVDAGISIEATFSEFLSLRKDCERIAARFRGNFT